MAYIILKLLLVIIFTNLTSPDVEIVNLRNIVNKRLAIPKLKLRIDQVTTQNEEVTYRRQYMVWKNRAKLRCDSIVTVNTQVKPEDAKVIQESENKRHIYCKGFETENKCCYTIEGLLPLQICNLDSNEKYDKILIEQKNLLIPDFEYLGMIHQMHKYQLGSFPAIPDSSMDIVVMQPLIFRAKWKPNGLIMEYDLHDPKEWKIVYKLQTGPDQYRKSGRVISRYSSNELIPDEVWLETFNRNGIISEVSKFTIQHLEFESDENEPFTLKGLGLKDGVTIMPASIQNQVPIRVVLDGKSVSHADFLKSKQGIQTGLPLPPTPAQPLRSLFWYYLLGSIAFLALTFIFLRRAFRT